MTTTTSRDERALLAAIAATPGEDTPRLAYADYLEDEGAVRVVCHSCLGNRKTYHKDHDYGDGEWVDCWTCRGTGTVLDTSRVDRAEFVRVQCELAGWRAADFEAKSLYDGDRMIDLSAREDILLAKHKAAWSRWSCPVCPPEGKRHVTCSLCGNSGDLFHGFEVEFRRGFPHRLTAPTFGHWVYEGINEDAPSGGWLPTSRLLACQGRTTVREFTAEDKEPVWWLDGGFTWLFASSGWQINSFNRRALLPECLRLLLPPKMFDTPALAVAALGRAVGEFASRRAS